MKHRNIFITFVLSLFTTMAALAQVPGYQGERFSINLTFQGFVALSNPTYVSNLNTNNTYPDNHINSNWIIDADYVVLRNGSVGISFQTLRTAANNITTNFITEDQFGNIGTTSVSNFIDIKTTGIGAYYKFFFFKSSGSIAPLGFYNRLDANLLFSSAVGSVQNTYYSPAPISPSITNYGNVATNLAIEYTLGTQSVLFNHLVTNIGIEVGVIPSYFLHLLDNTENETNSQQIARGVRSRLQTHILSNINVGLGYLIF